MYFKTKKTFKIVTDLFLEQQGNASGEMTAENEIWI